MAVIIDGKAVSKSYRIQLRAEAEAYEKKYGEKVGLAVILVGEDAASQVYVGNKIKACAEVGITSFEYRLSADTTQETLLALIAKLAADSRVHGILCQLPLPPHIDEQKVIAAIPSEKDVDGFSKQNVGGLVIGSGSLISCTPLGVMKLLEYYDINPSGKNAVVIGRSNIVGKPMALLLTAANATVTLCHSRTKDLEFYTKHADIVVVAVGKARMVKASALKDGAVVIDVGMNRVDGKLCGDVDFDSASAVAGYITPVPGGVGPMTITMLMHNTLKAAFAERGK